MKPKTPNTDKEILNRLYDWEIKQKKNVTQRQFYDKLISVMNQKKKDAEIKKLLKDFNQKNVELTHNQDKSERSKSSDDQTSKKSRISSSNSDTQTPEDKIKHPRTLDWDNEAKVWSRKRYGKEGIKLEFYYFKPTSGNVNFIITRENAEELVKELNIILKRLR